jgi:Ca2+-binding EF-hand superfamily protein
MKHVLSQDNLRHAFYSFDDNKDGKLSKEELKKMLKTTNIEIINDMIKHIDKNNDGYLSFQEFCDLMKSILNKSSNLSNSFDIKKYGTNIFIKTKTCNSNISNLKSVVEK